ncbi:GNAT family N-acetyltransferase [Alkaliphilus peptidifermentans]|uniref:Acetyltransferase (GNAT) family protein n=1 Tax=Alkaliphilus peptidifermentans DSM 18978 TaxID=1120976 RepID=A0A1G5LAH2_9FIRM|nr:GNAT family N-acetyltransferase [Alkaliphilus peptidifermentans]SCZ09963.1 Acetyltransferase (GNAT) family protein [Alkaliphilus peptidifermentans DSM 18978]
MDNIKYIEGGKELLDKVESLWKKLNSHHLKNSVHFKSRYINNDFQGRINKLESLEMKVVLVMDSKLGTIIGYCISTINDKMDGEIDSIYVEESYRSFKIGDKLIRDAINWLNENNVRTKKIAVAEGNEGVVEFYKRYGFYPRMMILEEADN